jgi:hypothetical protein
LITHKIQKDQLESNIYFYLRKRRNQFILTICSLIRSLPCTRSGDDTFQNSNEFLPALAPLCHEMAISVVRIKNVLMWVRVGVTFFSLKPIYSHDLLPSPVTMGKGWG